MFLEYHCQYHLCKCFLISLSFVLCFTYQNAIDIVFALFFTVDPASSFGLGLSRGQFCIVKNGVSFKSMFRSFDVHLRRLALLFFSQVRSPDLHHKSFFGDQLHGPGGSGLRILSGSSCIKSASGGAIQEVFHDAARGTKLVTPIALEGHGPRGTVFLTAISRSQG